MCESIPFPVYVRAAHLMFSTTIATSSSGSAFLQVLDEGINSLCIFSHLQWVGSYTLEKPDIAPVGSFLFFIME